jgi:hypothetical protein
LKAGLLDRLGIAPRGGALPLRLLTLLACLLVGGVFVYAALPKIRDPNAFALSVFHYQVAPDRIINLVALFLPWLELVCGLAIMLLPGGRRAAGWLLAGMLLLFAGLQISSILRGIDISCGCFSVDGETGHIGWLSVARNAGLLAATMLVVCTQRGENDK